MTIDEKLAETFSKLTDDEKKKVIIYVDSLLQSEAPRIQAS